MDFSIKINVYFLYINSLVDCMYKLLVISYKSKIGDNSLRMNLSNNL